MKNQEQNHDNSTVEEKIESIEEWGEGEIVAYEASEEGRIQATAWDPQPDNRFSDFVIFQHTEDEMYPDIDTELRIEAPYEGWELEEYYNLDE